MKLTLSKSFTNRDNLDDYIRSTFGEDAQVNKAITFESTAENLQSLRLSESSTVWGVKIKIAEEQAILIEEPVLGAVKKKKKIW